MLRRALILTIAFWAALAMACVGVVVAAVASMTGSEGAAARLLPSTAGISTPPTPAFAVPEPQRLDSSTVTAHWSSLMRTAVVYAAPSPRARPVGRIGRVTPEDTDNVVLIARSTRDEGGTPWVQVQFPSHQSGRAGWIRQGDLGPGGVSRSRLVVDRARLTLTLYRSGRAVLTAPIGIGRADSPTPAGRFYIRNKLTRYASAEYGPLAFGTSARSRLTDWPGGGFVGIHGTNRPELLPGAVSHGCIRMRNEDIVRLGPRAGRRHARGDRLGAGR